MDILQSYCHELVPKECRRLLVLAQEHPDMFLPLLHQPELGLAREDGLVAVFKRRLAFLVRKNGHLRKPIEGQCVEDEAWLGLLVEARCLGRAEPALEPMVQHELQLENPLVIRPIDWCCAPPARGRPVLTGIWRAVFYVLLEERTHDRVDDHEVRKGVHDDWWVERRR